MLELKSKHWLTTKELGIKNKQLQQAETENQRLKQENLELQKQVGNSSQPDYEATRDRTLTKLKMGRQSAAGKAIDAFIKELAKLPTQELKWKVGDKCRVTMPSGVVIDDGVIASIQPERGTCKISVVETGSHFSAELASLTRV
jgi:transcription antitermination factor NusG